jgi:aspartate aminotransferase-like enzyme
MLSFGDYVDRIYPIELEIKDISDTDWSASHLDPAFVGMMNDTKEGLKIFFVKSLTVK